MAYPLQTHPDLDARRGPGRRPGELGRRAFDLVVATVLLLSTLPVIVLLAIGSAIALRAWPFFVQDRVGRDGETFRFLKIRTLPPQTNAYADKYALAEVRIPRFTLLLRALHLDELPQLLLVVLGHMSLVGPRPEMPTLHAELPAELARTRVLVRPGVTGLWQVGVHCDGLIGEAPEYDSFYVAHQSLRLDLWILAQTARKVVRGGRGQVTLGDVPAWSAGATGTASAHLDDVLIDLTGHVGADRVAGSSLEAQPA